MDQQNFIDEMTKRGEPMDKINAYLSSQSQQATSQPQDNPAPQNQTSLNNNPYYIKSFLEPPAQLKQTQASTANTQANTTRTIAEQPGVEADTTLKVAQATALGIHQDAAAYFSNPAHQGQDGKVDPKDYNRYRIKFIGASPELGKGGDIFDTDFGPKFVNPNDIHYDIPANIAVRKALPLIKTVLQSYNKLDPTRVGPKAAEWASYMAKIPIVGGQMAQNYLSGNIAHDALLNTQAANIKGLISEGNTGYPLRNLIELGNMTNFLPTSLMAEKTAQAKTDDLDSWLRTNLSTDLSTVLKGGY